METSLSKNHAHLLRSTWYPKDKEPVLRSRSVGTSISSSPTEMTSAHYPQPEINEPWLAGANTSSSSSWEIFSFFGLQREIARVDCKTLTCKEIINIKSFIQSHFRTYSCIIHSTCAVFLESFFEIIELSTTNQRKKNKKESKTFHLITVMHGSIVA